MSRFEITCLTPKYYQTLGDSIAHIVIANPGNDFAPIAKDNFLIKGALYLHFSDECEEEALLWAKAGRQSINCITDRQAKEIVDFVRRMEAIGVELIIVNCEAGISRSSAVAGAILRALHGDDCEIFSSPRYEPNMFVYKTVLAEFQKSKD